MKIGITSDCSSTLEYAPFNHNIKITRTTIQLDGIEYIDGIDIKADEFYEKLATSNSIPTTAAPTPAEIIARVEEWKKEGCTDVIHFPISYGLSNYGQNLEMLKDDYVDGINLHVFNPRTGCIHEGYIAHYAEILANKGYSVEEIFAECEKMVQNNCTFFVVNNLQYLVKNGRLTAAKGIIGQLMKIKPILRLDKSGVIIPYEKVRTSQKAIERTIEIIKEETKDAKDYIITVQHVRRLDDAKALVEELKKIFPNAIIPGINTATPTIGAHIGCDIIGLGYIILDNLKEKEELKK